MANKPSQAAQKALLKYAHGILGQHKNNAGRFRLKLEIIDLAYARFTAAVASAGKDGLDLVEYRKNEADAARQLPENLRPPIVASQVGSAQGFLSEVFLSGSPLFPVLSTPANRKDAESLESIIESHSTLGGYPRQLMLFLHNCAKYNFAPIELDWQSLTSYRAETDTTQIQEGARMTAQSDSYTRLRTLDPYNTIWDHGVTPANCAQYGDYCGDVEVISHTRLRKEMAAMPIHAVNTTKVMNTKLNESFRQFQPHPILSKHVMAGETMDWVAWMSGATPKRFAEVDYADKAERVTLFVRIAPEDFHLKDPEDKVPHIYKLVIINYNHLVLAERVYTPLDRLPVLIGQPIEDGLGQQTQGIAESSIAIQDAAATLFDIRFASARRSVHDRGIYNQEMIDEEDINAPIPTAKIPAKVNSLLNQTLNDAYLPIPFDPRGTETALQDAVMISEWAKDLHGQNQVQQGQFQKGNKSVKEFDTVMGNSESRMRMPALLLEHQVFVPMKQILKLNIFRHFGTMKVPHHLTGEELDVDIRELRKKILEFRLADGFTPRSKMANVDMLAQGLTLISTSPILQQAYGASLPAMFAHLMQLGGVKGLDQYNPEVQQQGVLPNDQQTSSAVPGAPAGGGDAGGGPATGGAPV